MSSSIIVFVLIIQLVFASDALVLALRWLSRHDGVSFALDNLRLDRGLLVRGECSDVHALVSLVEVATTSEWHAVDASEISVGGTVVVENPLFVVQLSWVPNIDMIASSSGFNLPLDLDVWHVLIVPRTLLPVHETQILLAPVSLQTWTADLVSAE